MCRICTVLIQPGKYVSDGAIRFTILQISKITALEHLDHDAGIDGSVRYSRDRIVHSQTKDRKP